MRSTRFLKSLLLLVLAVFVQAANAQSNWPRNPETNKIEFAGTLPWPPEARTDKQRRVLVRNWYQKRLTSASLSDSTRAYLSSKPTWNNLPSHARISCEAGQAYSSYWCTLAYDVQLIPSATGLVYHLFNFYWGWPMDDMGSQGELETVLPYFPNYPPPEQEALKVFRNQLADALASW